MTSTGYSVCGILQLCFHPTCCVGYDCVLGKPVGLQDVCCLQIHTKLGFTSKCKSISKSCKKRSMISYTFFNTFLPFHQKTLLNKNQELWGIFAILLRCLWKFSRWIMWFQSAILYSKAEDRGVQPHQIFLCSNKTVIVIDTLLWSLLWICTKLNKLNTKWYETLIHQKCGSDCAKLTWKLRGKNITWNCSVTW